MHPDKHVESHMYHAEMLGLIPDDMDTEFQKHHVHVRDINRINQHLSEKREKHIVANGKIITAYDIYMDLPDDNKSPVRDMLGKDELIWSGQIAESNVNEMRIDLVPD